VRSRAIRDRLEQRLVGERVETARAELAAIGRRLERVAQTVHEESAIAARSRADLAALMTRLEAALEARLDRSAPEEES